MDYDFSKALTKIVQCQTSDTSFEGMDSTGIEKTINQEKTTKIMKRVQYHRKIRKRVRVPKQKIKHPPFTKWEDQRILELVLELGPRFQEIHKRIPNRTLSLVKNRYYKYLRYNWSSVLGKEYSKFNCLYEAQNQDAHLQLELENAGFQMECQDILSQFVQKMSSFFLKSDCLEL